MKYKIIALLVIVFSIITGCQSTQVEYLDVPNNEYDNLIITDINYDKSNETISFKTENKGDETISTGLHYTIEKLESNSWNKTNLTDNLMAIEIALILNPKQTIDEKINLSQIASLNDGFYRIKKEYNVVNNIVSQYIQFKVSNENLTDFSSYNSTEK